MSKDDWRGSFAIPMTPYDAHDRIDADVLADEIAFCVESGVGGIVVPVMVSEFFLLSEEERRLMIRVPVEASGGRVPIVANVAAVNTPLAVQYAEYAQQVGADAVIAMPPYIGRSDFPSIRAYYQAISDAVSIPVWIQNADIAPLSLDQVVTLCTEIENVSWVKEEVSPETQRIAALAARRSPAVHGIMGGNGGRYLITEWARGAAGCIHACQFCDLIQDIWDMLDGGQESAARDLFDVVLPGLVLEGIFGMAYAKEVMVRRGVFTNTRMRGQTRPLDADDLREIDAFWTRIEPHLTWRHGA
jgi:4-hydroxy-tetrahydrodipicolinate synthase